MSNDDETIKDRNAGLLLVPVTTATPVCLARIG